MVDKTDLQGAWDKAKGVMKEGVGTITGNEKMRSEGMAEQTKGKAESAAGGVNDTPHDTADRA